MQPFAQPPYDGADVQTEIKRAQNHLCTAVKQCTRRFADQSKPLYYSYQFQNAAVLELKTLFSEINLKRTFANQKFLFGH